MSSFSVVTFLKDREMSSFESFKEKYDSKIPINVLIKTSIQELKNKEILHIIVDDNWYGDTRDKHCHYLIKKNNIFEVFISERNGRHCLETFSNLEEAAFAKLDALFNEMGHPASDSIINK